MIRKTSVWPLILVLMAGASHGIGGVQVPAGEKRPASTPRAAAAAPLVDSLMARFMADSGNVGVSVAVVRGTDTISRGAWGLADRDTGRPATTDTSYRLGSTSKQFTAALIMRLVERSRVSLDDLVETHLPQMPPRWRGTTVRQLLNHTSGIPDFTGTGSRHWPKTLPPDGLLALVGGDNLHFKPGTKYEYSNSNYVLLALIAEKYFARPLARILDEEIFTPLGLTSMRFCEDAYGANGQARPYVRDGDRVEDAPYRSVSHSYGAGGICSTAGDVAAWNHALHTGRVISAASYALMTTPEGAAKTEPYGFGLGFESIAGRSALYHGGLVPGFICVNAWFPAESLSVTVLTNTSPTPQMRPLTRDLARLALGLPVTIANPLDAAPLEPAALRRYAGTYTIQVPGRPLDIRFWVDGHTLKSQATGQTEGPMRQVGEHAFGSARDWSVRFAFQIENGAATGFTFEQGGATFPGVRKR
jgi:CubicO group peptidase (beta-lactamase class C family)